ncbi:FHA domain-containing protein [Rubripirellula amarantea]|nr:FHA domain-containing protein [Rubripirellula amarantea]
MASLFVVRGRDQGKHFHLQKSTLLIGRESTCDIQLLDSESSRNHAELHRGNNGQIEIVDLDSSNGTRVNGNRISREVLSSGDRIEIGSTLLIFTGTNQPKAIEAAHGVDIVEKSLDDGSRIVSSLSQSASESSPAVVVSNSSEARISEADRSLEVMYLTAIAVGRTDDLGEVLQRVLRLVFDWVEADRGCVMLQDQQSGRLRPAARCDSTQAGDKTSDDRHETRPISISQTILQYVMEHKEGVRTSNARSDTRFDAAVSIVTAGVREALCVPLQGRYGIVGAMYIDTYTPPGELIASGHKQRFTDDHLRLITAIGHQAALAIEDTTYYSALVQSERLAAMGQTIATLSHHIKNILQGISGGSYLIEAGLKRDDTDAVRKGWGIVDRNQERISNLVMDMLTFSKEREPEKVEADLNETVQDAVDLMQTRASQCDVRLVAELAESMPMAWFDPDAMHRAVLNLITNAIDAASGQLTREEDFDVDDADSATSVEPHVRVRTQFDSEYGWRVDVMDNGPGVLPEDREKIFSLFESRKGMRGTGLGLPVSAKIMREHGGDISIVDIADESGTCFRLQLPPRGTQASDLALRETLG